MDNLINTIKWRKIDPGKQYDEEILMIDKTHRNYPRTGFGNRWMGTATHYIPVKLLENALEYEE